MNNEQVYDDDYEDMDDLALPDHIDWCNDRLDKLDFNELDNQLDQFFC